MSVLDAFLKKIGVQKYDDLNSEEKDTFREWEIGLQGRTVTETDYRNFLETELEIAVSRLTDVDLKKEDEIFRKVEVRFIKKILHLLDMPKMEKKLLEEQIKAR